MEQLFDWVILTKFLCLFLWKGVGTLLSAVFKVFGLLSNMHVCRKSINFLIRVRMVLLSSGFFQAKDHALIDIV